MGARLRLAPGLAGVEIEPAVSPPIRVVLADSHRLMRRSLRLLLDGESGIEVVGEAADLSEAMEQVNEKNPALLVADLAIGEATDGETLHDLMEHVSPGTGLVVLTIESIPGFARKALGAGALGLVSKQFADTELDPAIRAAARGEVYVSPPIAARLGPANR
jgi:DNA-binding NarL/FixJ family response regulator